MYQSNNFEPKINDPCIVIWDEQDGRKWFVAVLKVSELTALFHGAFEASSVGSSKKMVVVPIKTK